MKSAFEKIFWAVDGFLVNIFKFMWALFGIALFASFHIGLIFLAVEWSGGSIVIGFCIWVGLFWLVGGLFHFLLSEIFGRRDY